MDFTPSISDLRSGDPKVSGRAWAAAYELLWQKAMTILPKALGGGHNEQNHKDIASRAISDLWRGLVEKKLPSFNQIETFDDLLGMFTAILRRRIIEQYRKKGREPKEIVEVTPESILMVAAPVPPMENEDFERLLALMPPPKPEIFRLHVVERLTAQEIAKKLGCPRGTICCHLSRGKRILKEYGPERLRKYLDGGRGLEPPPSSSDAPHAP